LDSQDENLEGFEELLGRSVPPPEPSRELRRRLRKAFLEGVFGEERELLSKTPSRSGESPRSSERLDTRLERKLAALPLAPPADPDFRSRLQSSFVDDSWDAAPEDPQEPVREESLHPVPPPEVEARGGGLLRMVLPFAAAAAILFVALLPGDPRWEVEFLGEGTVRVGEVEFGPADARRLATVLGQGALLTTADTGLGLRLDTGVEARVLPATEVSMNELDGDSPLYFGVEMGEVFVATHPDYPGSRINVGSDLGRVALTDTSIGVMRYENGFCVCVSEGVVKAISQRHPEDDWLEVEAGLRYYIPSDFEKEDFLEPQGEHPHFEHLREFTRDAFR